MSLPYNALLYHLDLCILAYQLHGQTLAIPWDPYYESLGDDRKQAMKYIYRRARNALRSVDDYGARLSDFRGPPPIYGAEVATRTKAGVVHKFLREKDDIYKDTHDPILQRYHVINPQHECFTRATGQGKWLRYRTPSLITDPISDVRMCCRVRGIKGFERRVAKIEYTSKQSGKDVLIAFEGETGLQGAEVVGSASLMGFVLGRYRRDNTGWDLHIAFRGSRSGAAGPSRLVEQALGAGNPDWLTNLVFSDRKDEKVSKVGEVHVGFSSAMLSALPNVDEAVAKVKKSLSGEPVRIYITGHSLGGGLAQMFCSAVAGTKNYPLKKLRLMTFAAPRTGNQYWAKDFNKKMGIDSLFATWIAKTDWDAKDPLGGKFYRSPNWLGVPEMGAPKDYETRDNEPDPFKLEQDGPKALRILMSGDPITTKFVVRGYHVGQTVYVDAKDWKNDKQLKANGATWFHQPFVIREELARWIEASHKKSSDEKPNSIKARKEIPWEENEAKVFGIESDTYSTHYKDFRKWFAGTKEGYEQLEARFKPWKSFGAPK